MTAHAVVSQSIDAPAAAVFELIHDYPRRLQWDTLLRRARVIDGEEPGVGVRTACSAKWYLGGMTFRTRYVTFRPGELAAVTLLRPTSVFATWAASIRHRPLADDRSEVTYTLTFGCRPQPPARLVEPVALAAFRFETARRLPALAAYFHDAGNRPAG